jgi:hypothetical protein
VPYNDPKHQTTDDAAHLLTQLTRIGSAIDKELTLISERMTWLVVSNGLCFLRFFGLHICDVNGRCCHE